MAHNSAKRVRVSETTAVERAFRIGALVSNVLEFLSTREVCRAQTVCKGFQHASSAKRVWARLDFSNAHPPWNTLDRWIERAGSALTHLNMDHVKDVQDEEGFFRQLTLQLVPLSPRTLTLSFRGWKCDPIEQMVIHSGRDDVADCPLLDATEHYVRLFVDVEQMTMETEERMTIETEENALTTWDKRLTINDMPTGTICAHCDDTDRRVIGSCPLCSAVRCLCCLLLLITDCGHCGKTLDCTIRVPFRCDFCISLLCSEDCEHPYDVAWS